MADDPASPGDGPEALTRVTASSVAAAEPLPVVARLAIEIRSDGIRTVARGAMHDLGSDQQVAIEVSAGSVMELGARLAAAVGKTLLSLPRLLLTRRRPPRG